MDKFINYNKRQIKKYVKEVDGFGTYFVVDNFIDKQFFEKLNEELLEIKANPGKLIDRTSKCTPMGYGVDKQIGGGDKAFSVKLDKFKHWKSFLKLIYSLKFKEFMFSVWEDTSFYEKLSEQYKKTNTGCKLSFQTDGYGWPIHPDSLKKVISFLFYLDNRDWLDDSKGGTDLWKVTNNLVEWDREENSMDYYLRKEKDAKKEASLDRRHADYIEKFKSIDFVPNRLVGFVRTNTSYHSIPLRKLPDGVTRDCFQVNVWDKNN